MSCAALGAAAVPEATITEAAAIPAGSFSPPDGSAPVQVPAFCRVDGVLHPSSDSHIYFEVWLPEQEKWNHRFLGIGNGGFAGSIYYEQLAGNLQRGFATAGSDAGHEATAEDASWAYGHPEKVKDFGYRAVHLTTQLGKALAAQFYGSQPNKSYFDSCSDGGREALMEAQRYPEDYDGILAGAPANNWTRLLTGGLALDQAMLRNPAAYLSSLKLPAITEAVLAQCDAADGLKDGILTDPRSCHFDPQVLLCKGEESARCLTPPQIATLRRIYTGVQGMGGDPIFPGLMPGGEAGGWKSWVTGEQPAVNPYVENYFRYMVESDPTWNALTADINQALATADAKTAQAIDATDPDLMRFAARGGKLVMYHGWNDPAISPLNTVNYYGSVEAKMGAGEAARFLRLYMVPGMQHCIGGPGPSAFGQLGVPTAAKGDPFAIFAALQTWTEGGAAPGPIIATKWSAEHKPEMTRPICPYPEVPKYQGAGSADDAASFHCAESETPSQM